MYATHTHHFFRREEDGMVRSPVKRVDGVSLQGHLHALNNEGFHEDVKRTTRHIQCASNLVEALKTTKKSRRSGRYPPQTDESLTIGSSNNFDRREGSTGINARPRFHCKDNNAPRRPALPPIDLRFHNHRNASQLVSTGTSSPPSPSSSTTTSSATSPSHACLSACAVLTKANVLQLPFLSAPPPCPRTCHCPASASLARPSIPQTRRSPNRLPGTYTGKLATIHNVHNNDPTAGSVQSTSLPRIAPLSFTPPPPPFSNFYPGRTLQFSASLRSYRLLHGVGGLDHCKPQTHVMAAQALSSSAAAPKVAVKIVQQAWIQRHASPSPPFSPLAAPFLPSICRPVGELEAVRLLSYSSVHPNVMPVLDVEQDKDYLYLVFPYAGGGELFEKVSAYPQGLPESTAQRFFKEMCDGLAHLKRHNLSHGDVSLENVMLYDPEEGGRGGGREGATERGMGRSEMGISCGHDDSTEGEEEEEKAPEGGLDRLHCRLIDLEMARYVPTSSCPSSPPSYYPMGGKSSYAPPEAFYNRPSSPYPLDPYACDIWALGICLYMLCTGRPLYQGPEDDAFLLLASGGAPGLLNHYEEAYGLTLPRSVHKLLAGMLCPEGDQRMTLEEVMRWKWVQAGGTEEEEEEEESSAGCWSPATTVEDEGEEGEEGEEGVRCEALPILVFP